MDDVTAKVSSKGQVTIPKPVRDALRISGGRQVVFRVEENRAMVARTKRLLDVPAGDSANRRVAPNPPWDASRRSRLQSRAKPQRRRRKEPATPHAETEFTVDLRSELAETGPERLADDV